MSIHPDPLDQRAAGLPVVLAVAAGGAVGTCLRVALGDLVPPADASFPWTTFWINVSGSALLACLLGVPAVRRRPLLTPALGTGVLGGFTTLSVWSLETNALLAADEVALAAVYAVGTLLACLGAVATVDRLVRRSRPSRQGLPDGRGGS